MWIRSFIISLSALIVSVVINFYAGRYATKDVSNSVTDVILSNIPLFDVDGIFVYGSIVFVICITIVCFMYPRRIPFTLKSLSLFILIRDVFVNLTHIAPFPAQVTIDPLSIIRYFAFGGDLFFSGHTGMPFLLALIYWKNKKLRYFFLAFSAVFAVVVLMGHLHYSIDVFAAFFITYSIYHLAEKFFKKDKLLAEEAEREAAL